MAGIFKFDENMINLVEEEALRFIGAFLVMIIALFTRKQYQQYKFWHFAVNMAFWQCLIPALVLEFQEPVTKTMNPLEMSLAIGIGVALSTFFGIRSVLETLPVADYVAAMKDGRYANRIIIKSQATSLPKIIINNAPYARVDEREEVVAAQNGEADIQIFEEIFPQEELVALPSQ